MKLNCGFVKSHLNAVHSHDTTHDSFL